MFQVLTIVISFVIFSKPIQFMHVVGFGFFIGSVAYGYSLKARKTNGNGDSHTNGGGGGGRGVQRV